jgi:hypothetical protein
MEDPPTDIFMYSSVYIITEYLGKAIKTITLARGVPKRKFAVLIDFFYCGLYNIRGNMRFRILVLKRRFPVFQKKVKLP